MDICLVNMPFTDLDKPNIALSLFRSELKLKGISSHIEYANHKFAEFAGFDIYKIICRVDFLLLFGEYLFASSAGFIPDKEREKEYLKTISKVVKKLSKDAEIYQKCISFFHKHNEIIESYLNKLADDILNHDPTIVACSSCYQQNNASFALLKKIKERASSVITLIGGCNCAGEAGIAISRKLQYIDYVFSGEGDGIFTSIVGELINKKEYLNEELPHGLIRRGMYSSETIPYRVTQKLDLLEFPDYSDFISICSKNNINPILMVEGSRGCWWREKSPCTFCGLEVSSQKFRAKETSRLVSEIEELSMKYSVNNLFFTDCVLSNIHVEELPACFKNKSYTFFAEIKTNITKSKLIELRKAGFTILQPGIESLQDDMLKLMKKGNRAIYQIAFLKYARELRIHTVWNILIGFPGEQEEWILEMAQLLPKITHLQPPGTLRHIIYQRNSTYFNDPSKYGLNLLPAWPYKLAYGCDSDFIQAVAYNFEPSEEQDIAKYYCFEKKGEAYSSLLDAVRSWIEAYNHNSNCLKAFIYDTKIELLDMRDSAHKNYYTLVNAERDLYLLCDEPIGKQRLMELLLKDYSEIEINAGFHRLLEAGLIIEINQMVLALATNAKNIL